MPHTFHQLYFHFIWATHSREPLIDRRWRPQFLALLNEEVKNRGGLPLRHNVMPEHAHLLVRLRPTTLISEFIGRVKGATSYRVNHEINPRFKLRWQEGYDVMSLRRDECEKVAHYIDNQEAHHRHGSLSGLLETIDITEDDWRSSGQAQERGIIPSRERISIYISLADLFSAMKWRDSIARRIAPGSKCGLHPSPERATHRLFRPFRAATDIWRSTRRDAPGY